MLQRCRKETIWWGYRRWSKWKWSNSSRMQLLRRLYANKVWFWNRPSKIWLESHATVVKLFNGTIFWVWKKHRIISRNFSFITKRISTLTKNISVIRMQPSNVEIFFKDHYVRALKRSETHTISNFLAMCGGLFGLFLGCSALSIVEFIYTITRRLYLHYRQRKSQNAVGSIKSGNINDSFIANMGI